MLMSLTLMLSLALQSEADVSHADAVHCAAI